MQSEAINKKMKDANLCYELKEHLLRGNLEMFKSLDKAWQLKRTLVRKLLIIK